MPPSSTTGSSTSLSSRTTTSTRPSSRVERLGTPKTPAIRFTRAMNFAASWFTHLLRPASLLALLYGSDQIAPAIEGFYIQAFGRSVTLPTAGYDYNSDWTPCMGLFLSRSFSRAAHLFSFVSFFIRYEILFLRLRPEAVARRSCQGWSPLGDQPQGLALTVPSTAAPSNAVGLGQQDDDQRGARIRARIYRATTLYSVGPRTRTMMQSCASVRSSEAADPFSVTA
jgi:hypothetical protein